MLLSRTAPASAWSVRACDCLSGVQRTAARALRRSARAHSRSPPLAQVTVLHMASSNELLFADVAPAPLSLDEHSFSLAGFEELTASLFGGGVGAGATNLVPAPPGGDALMHLQPLQPLQPLLPSQLAAVPDAMPHAAPAPDGLRCFDVTHPPGCTLCTPPPPEGAENAYELSGDEGKKNGCARGERTCDP